MRKFIGAIPVLLIAAVIAAGAVILTRDSGDPAATATAAPTAPATEVVAEKLEVPWDIAFLSDSRALITERPGRVRLLEDGKLRPEPVLTLETAQRGEGGRGGC